MKETLAIPSMILGMAATTVLSLPIIGKQPLLFTSI